MNNMFEWLESELETIKTPRFHIVDGPAELEFRNSIIKSSLHLPLPYKEFVLRFGAAKLYRNSRCGYTIGVFAEPREMILGDGTRVYQIGFHDSAAVFIKSPEKSREYPVFERMLRKEYRVADDFEKWLTTACLRARSEYGPEKWIDIENGPAPFSTKEKEIVETRRKMAWRVVGIDSSGDHIFEISNKGRITLPVLTVGVRSKDGRLNGALRLKTGDVTPGDTAILHVSCYKGIVQSRQIEIFTLPDPQPEDRDYYAEFRGCN